MPPISVLMKPASGMCNMKCDYCFYHDETEKREQKSFGFMSEQTLKNIIRKTLLRAEGYCCYAYQGGEPTLRGLDFYEQAVAYQKQYNKNHVQVDNALQTNGYAMTEEWCKFFKKNNFLIGLSVDGTEEIHDTYRHNLNGTGTFIRVLEAAKLMDLYGVDYNVLTVVNAKVAANIQDIYAEYKKHGWKYQQYIPCLDPLGEARGNKEYSLTPKLYGQFLIDLFELWYTDLQKDEQPYIRQFENFVALLTGRRAEACDQNGICGCANIIEADGSVYPCDFYMLDEYKLGNFNENSLTDINDRRKEIKFIENSIQISENCIKCNYYVLCRAGCYRNREVNKNTGIYENFFCESYQMFFDVCFERFSHISRICRREGRKSH